VAADGSATPSGPLAPGDAIVPGGPGEVAAGTNDPQAAVVHAVPADATHSGASPLVVVVVVAIVGLLLGTAWRSRARTRKDEL
jgi:hypothetical protein